MRATLQFDLQTESQEFRDAQNGQKYRRVVNDLDDMMRLNMKHGEHSDHELAIYETIRNKLYSLLNDYNIEL